MLHDKCDKHMNCEWRSKANASEDDLSSKIFRDIKNEGILTIESRQQNARNTQCSYAPKVHY